MAETAPPLDQLPPAPGTPNSDDDDDDEPDDLPDFANQENRSLHKRLKETEKQLAVQDGELAETKERIQTMSQHLIAVQEEQKTTQKLLESKLKEIETEDHLKQITERESSRFTAELQKLKRECTELADRATVLQAAILAGTEKLDAFRVKMDMNQEELEQWALAARQKEEDNIALERYAKADENKNKALIMQLQKLQSRLQEAENELNESVTETQAKQVELDKTGAAFGKMHEERQSLISQWESALEAVRVRDEQVQKVQEELAKHKGELAQKQAVIKSAEEFLEREQKNNEEAEMAITNCERAISTAHEEKRTALAFVQEAEEQEALAKSALSQAAAELAKLKNEYESDRQTLDKNREKLSNAKIDVDEANQELATSRDAAADLEKAAKRMEDIHTQEATRLRQKEREQQRLKERLFTQSQKLHSVQKKESNLKAEVEGARRLSRNVSNRVTQLDAQAMRQRELVYTVEFQYQMMERKVSRASGVRTPQQQNELKEKIGQLQQVLKEATAQVMTLQQQSKRLGNDHTRAIHHSKSLEVEGSKLKSSKDELDLSIELAEKELAAARQKRDESLISHDVLRLQVKRLRERLGKAIDAVFGLQNRKHQLNMSMEERQQEINVHMNVLRSQLRAAEDERSAAVKELTDRSRRAENLQSKYDVVRGRMGFEDGEEQSQAYYVIKAAQEREELQRQGDELDNAILKAEKEIKALEKTCAHLFAKNASYKASFVPVASQTAEAERKLVLENEVRASVSEIRAQRLLQAELEEEIAQLEQTAHELTADLDALNNKKERALSESSAFASTRVSTAGDLANARARVTTLVNEYRQAAAGATTSGPDALELELSLRETRLANIAMLEKLMSIGTDVPGYSERLREVCADAGIPPPSSLPGYSEVCVE